MPQATGVPTAVANPPPSGTPVCSQVHATHGLWCRFICWKAVIIGVSDSLRYTETTHHEPPRARLRPKFVSMFQSLNQCTRKQNLWRRCVGRGYRGNELHRSLLHG